MTIQRDVCRTDESSRIWKLQSIHRFFADICDKIFFVTYFENLHSMRCTICSIKNSRFWDTVKCNETIPICNIQVLITTYTTCIYIASSWERKWFLFKSCKEYLNSISLAWSIDIKTITCQNQKTESKTTTWCNKNEWGIVIWLNLQNIQNIWVFFLI